MPIRAGSGGLKYPLPSQAEIQGRASAAAASAGGSASASAYGANRRYAAEKMQIQSQAQQAGLGREFTAQQNYYSRQHQMGGQLSAQRARMAEQVTGDAARADLEDLEFAHKGVLQEDAQQHGFDINKQQAQLDAEAEERQYKRAQESTLPYTYGGVGGPLPPMPEDPAAPAAPIPPMPQMVNGFPVITSADQARMIRGETGRMPDGSLRRVPDDYMMT